MLSVFLCSSRGQLPVASCQLPVVSRQSYWSRASHRLSGLASTCTNMFAVVRNSRRIRDFWQYLARGYHVPRGQLINWRTKHLPCPCPSLSPICLSVLSSFQPEWLRALHLFTCYAHARAVATISVLALASLLSHRLSKDEHTHIHTHTWHSGWEHVLCFASFRPNCQSKSVKDVRHRRLQCTSLNQEAFLNSVLPLPLPVPSLNRRLSGCLRVI